MTFSVVAHDPTTGDLGIAVQSKYLAVGSIVGHGRSGAGVIATQFFANPALAATGLALLEEGRSPDDVIETMLNGDPHRVRRQFVVMATDGSASTFTGEACLDHAGAVQAEGVVCCGNTLASERVLVSMLEAYQHAGTEPFWTRLVGSLAAGQAAGGDVNGQQSASILVLRRQGGYGGYTDRMIDLRVDDSPFPITELARLIHVWAEAVVE
jgi:uncharacterized Ntn-hydrolase superfamily protein